MRYQVTQEELQWLTVVGPDGQEEVGFDREWESDIARGSNPDDRFDFDFRETPSMARKRQVLREELMDRRGRRALNEAGLPSQVTITMEDEEPGSLYQRPLPWTQQFMGPLCEKLVGGWQSFKELFTPHDKAKLELMKKRFPQAFGKPWDCREWVSETEYRLWNRVGYGPWKVVGLYKSTKGGPRRVMLPGWSKRRKVFARLRLGRTVLKSYVIENSEGEPQYRRYAQRSLGDWRREPEMEQVAGDGAYDMVERFAHEEDPTYLTEGQRRAAYAEALSG